MTKETTFKAEVLPPDHTKLTDPNTGAELTFLTTNTSSTSHYFHERSWLVDSSMIIFCGYRGLMGYLTATGELVVLATPTGNVTGATAAAKRNAVFGTRDGDVLELTPHVELSSDPARKPSTVEITERVITTLPQGGALNGNYDDTYLAIGQPGDPWTINTIRVADGETKQIVRLDPPMRWCGHVQWSRTSSNLISFAQGNDWKKNEDDLDRIWVVDPEEGIPRPVYHQIIGELVTHESWWVEDKILYCGAPPAVGHVGDPDRREMAHVNVLDYKTGIVRVAGAGNWWAEGTDMEVWKRNWWHCAGSEDGRWIIADTFHHDIVLFEATTTRGRLLTGVHTPNGGSKHPEPGWDRKGEQVIFSSHMLAKPGDPKPTVCVATVPPAWQKENPAPLGRQLRTTK